MNSPLRWAGAKRWHVEEIRRRWNGIARIVEPFCGGASISLGLEPERAWLNDTNPVLMNFWRCLREGNIGKSHPNLPPEQYYEHRGALNDLIKHGHVNTFAAADYFYALNQRCFNGIWRVNAKGQFNVPPRKTIKELEPLYQESFRLRMQFWGLSCGDFEQVPLGHGDLIYADPPYDAGFTAYSSEGFTWDDQQRLAVWLSVHDGPVIAMNKATERILKLYQSLGFFCEVLDAGQKMQRSRGRTDTVLEMMATRC